MAGSISLSMSQQFGANGKPLVGGKVYFYAANTSTPQNAFQDTGLTIPHPNPLPLVGQGRVPEFYLADGNIHFRLVDKNGVPQFEALNALVIGPSSGGGGGGSSVDPTAIFQVGDCIWLDFQGTRSGWVRDNGRTLGSAVSGATERANADCLALFTYLYNNFSNTICPVVGGRGANAAADWAANKQITLPDKRGYAPAGLDGMGNTTAGRYAGVPLLGGGPDTAGSLYGEASHSLSTGELPTFTPSGNVALSLAARVPITWYNVGPTGSGVALDGPGGGGGTSYWNVDFTTADATFTGNQIGGNGAHNNTGLRVLGTFYRKL